MQVEILKSGRYAFDAVFGDSTVFKAGQILDLPDLKAKKLIKDKWAKEYEESEILIEKMIGFRNPKRPKKIAKKKTK